MYNKATYRVLPLSCALQWTLDYIFGTELPGSGSEEGAWDKSREFSNSHANVCVV